VVNLDKLIGFDWDKGNLEKNWIAHQVNSSECEEVFFNLPLLVEPDESHSIIEPRYYVLGKTNQDRYLFVAFTIRNNKIRVISVRDMSRKERKTYEKANT
jgi:uncharacterized protein